MTKYLQLYFAEENSGKMNKILLSADSKMATSMLPIRPVGVRACATSHRRSDVNGRKSSSSNWWSPLFGWSTEPDYIESDNKNSDSSVSSKKPEEDHSDSSVSSKKPEEDHDQRPLVKSRFAPGSFTEEKAKQLRMMTNETATFHDIMYHSAIASRLASDFSNNRSDR